jgi:hypothetical protein
MRQAVFWVTPMLNTATSQAVETAKPCIEFQISVSRSPGIRCHEHLGCIITFLFHVIAFL